MNYLILTSVVYPQDAGTPCRKPYPRATTIQFIHHTKRDYHDTRLAMDMQHTRFGGVYLRS